MRIVATPAMATLKKLDVGPLLCLRFLPYPDDFGCEKFVTEPAAQPISVADRDRGVETLV